MKLLLTLFIFLMSSNYAFADYKKQYLSESNTLVFDDEVSQIKLRGARDLNSSLITVSYVITIKEPMFEGNGTICISLIDADDFELTKKELSRVVSEYQGTFRGKFYVEQKEYSKISSVALFFLTTSS